MKKEEKNTNEKGIFKATELASYITYKYYMLDKKTTEEISPLKLQKSLYFCFAYWGGFIRQGKSKQSEINISNYDEYLFNDKIEAWVYGPVVPNVYRSDVIEKNDGKSIFDGKEYVKDFIDGILEDVLNTSDFKLVSLSHEDQCWKRNFKKSEIFHNNEIPKEEIIKEYAKQF